MGRTCSPEPENSLSAERELTIFTPGLMPAYLGQGRLSRRKANRGDSGGETAHVMSTAGPVRGKLFNAARKVLGRGERSILRPY